MKKRSIVIALSIFMLMASVVWAASVNGEFKGFPVVNVKINGKTVSSDVPAVNFFGSTLLPVRAVAEAMNAVVAWDNKTATADLIKPEVTIIIADSVQKSSDGQKTISNSWFSFIKGYQSFAVYSEINSLSKGHYETRIAIYDPKNNLIYASQPSTYEALEDNDGYYTIDNFENISFSELGQYSFQLQMKYNGEFKTIGTKTVTVVAE